MIIDEIKSIEFDRNKNKTLGIKSAILWGHKDNEAFPLLYIRKPKHLSQDDFEDILDRLKIDLYKKPIK